MLEALYDGEGRSTFYGDYKIVDSDGRIMIKVVNFPEHESMWVELKAGNENDGIGQIRNCPSSYLKYGDWVRYGGGTDEAKPRYINDERTCTDIGPEQCNRDRTNTVYLLWDDGSFEQEILSDEERDAFEGSSTPGGGYRNLIYYWWANEWFEARHSISSFDT